MSALGKAAAGGGGDDAGDADDAGGGQRRAAVAACAGLQLLELQKCRALSDDSLPPLLCASGALRLLNLTDCALLRRPRLASASLVTVHLYNCLALVAPTIECASLELSTSLIASRCPSSPSAARA